MAKVRNKRRRQEGALERLERDISLRPLFVDERQAPDPGLSRMQAERDVLRLRLGITHPGGGE